MYFSIIIPVYNRPDEINELLESLVQSTYKINFEIVIVEDGSTITCEDVIQKYSDLLSISYYFKPNSGPGDSRNFGMKKAKGDYYIIFDSDCIIPTQYLSEVEKELKFDFVDCFGGPDKSLDSFSNIQKAINFAMTSFLTTGGIRGGSEKIDKFQPRSFNMGISKKAFQASKGFGNIHPGEDPDLSIRLWKLDFETRLFPTAFVYHKRRIDWEKFSVQVSKFGKARPILNSWYPEYKKITYWFPSIFIIGFVISIALIFVLMDWALKIYFLYFIILFVTSSVQNRSPVIGYLSIVAVWKQFFGYGIGFMTSFYKISVLGKQPQEAFPELFFKVSDVEDNFERSMYNINNKKNAPIHKSVEKAIDKIINPLQKLVEPVAVKSKIIGLTGGIGSGKTAVANYIQSKGIPVYISDVEAKKVMDFPDIISQIAAAFGTEIIESNNTLNRDKLASIVFNEPEKLKQLNAIVHPAVKKHFDFWIIEHNKFPIIIKETAILFESGSYKDCDSIITVSAPLETRIQRVLERDKTTREKIIQRINNQLSDEERIERSQFVVKNINFDETKIQIDEILNSLKNK
jgi:dephospho-CoA kinase